MLFTISQPAFTCSKSTMKHQNNGWNLLKVGIFRANFEQISSIALVFRYLETTSIEPSKISWSNFIINEIWRRFLKCYAMCLGALRVLVEILYRSQEKNCSKEDSFSFNLVFLEMLLRLFIIFYNLEIIEEDIFLKWKEDINDFYPGKGKALFQVILQRYFTTHSPSAYRFCYLKD